MNVDVEDLFHKRFKKVPSAFFENFTVKFIDISFDKGIWIVACEISGKIRPKYTVGLQGAYSKEKAVYRSLMEALTVMAYSINMSWLKPDQLAHTEQNLGTMDNLDKNVAYYAMNGKPRKMNVNSLLLEDKPKVKNLAGLLKANLNLLKWGGL